MKVITRRLSFFELFPDAPIFRWRQVLRALFDPAIAEWAEITTLSKEMREKLSHMPWISLRESIVLSSRRGDTEKALLECADGTRIETVLMRNARGHWSVCVSSQIGCAMSCSFCATGRMGLSRNLTADEIVDQIRFWQHRLATRRKIGAGTDNSERITNVVFMGMGEPLANYESVREAICQILEYTDIGPTRITVSTVGLLPAMRRLLDDPLWPPVRLAVSLHSADSATRSRLMPTSFDGFLDKLAEWTLEYFARHDERRRHLTFEHILIRGENDSSSDAEKLIQFSRRIGKVKVNLIPYNETSNPYRESEQASVAAFAKNLRDAGIVVTVRKTMGDDIAAACGQLAGEVTLKGSVIEGS